MASYGGKREGAGRKKASHTIAAEQARAYITQRVVEELEPLVSAQLEIAKDKSHKASTYAAKELFERALGKVTDKLQIEKVKKLINLDE